MDLSNLLAHWRLEETGTATRINAHTSYPSYGLSQLNSPPSITGLIDDANDFNGTNQYLYDFDSSYHPGDADWEINGWVKFDTFASGKPVVFGGGPVFGDKCYMLLSNATTLEFRVSDNGASWTTTVTSTVAISTGVWYFFRVWHDHINDQIGIRVNGETIVTAAHSTGVYTAAFPSTYLLLALRTDSVQFLDGQLDSVSFWTRILSSEEGLVVYNGGAGLDYPWPSASIPGTSFFEAVKRPTLTPIVLAEIEVGIWLRAWLVDGTYTNSYKISIVREDALGNTFPLNITSVKWNLTTEMEERISVAAVDGNVNSFYSDGTYLWIRPPSGTPFGNTVQAFATFYLSQNAKVLNDTFWEPRIASVPNLSQRIEAVFGGVGQIGGGSISLVNHDGYFNQMQDFQWHHGSVRIRLGIDLPNEEMAWDDYQIIATWSVKDWRRDETAFILSLQEPKAKIKTKIPFTFFDRAAYPNIEDAVVGKPIPIAYGKIYGAEPILIDPGLKKFIVASHAIKSFDGVRIKVDREESRTITTSPVEWQRYSGTVYRFYLSVEEATNVTFGSVSLAHSNSVEDVLTTAGSWVTSENYVYVNPSTGQTIDSGVYSIAAKKSVSGFVTTNFASVDAANGQFTLGDDWSIGTEVSVDFRGKSNSNGSLMDNSVDIISDLLDTVGETNVDDSSLSSARSRFLLGYDENGSEVNCMRPSIYLTEAKEVLEIIDLINRASGCFLFSDELGRFHLGAFLPQTGDSLPIYTDLDIMDFEEMTDAEETLSKEILKYQNREQDEFAQIEVLEQTANQYISGQPHPVTEEETVELSEEPDAEYWDQRTLLNRGFPLKKFTFRLPWNALLQKPGEQIHIQSNARQLDEVLEILEVRRDLSAKQVTLVVGNLRNYGDTPGFWVDSAAVLPARFSALSGYGSGSLTWNSSWDDEIKTWVRQNVGNWTDANGFADTADPESFLHSVWV